MLRVPLKVVLDDEDPRQASVFVELQVDGQPVEALLDSGAARSAILERPDLTPWVVRDPSTGVFGVHADQQHAQVAVRFAGQDLGSIDVEVVPGDHGAHGALVGQDVLSRFRCEYRLGDAVLILDGNLPQPAHPIHVGLRRHVYLPVTWPTGESADAVFDTGASVTVVDQRFAAQHPRLFTHEGVSEGTDSTGTVLQVPMAQMSAVHLLGAEFGPSLAAVVDLSAANAIIDRRMDLILGWPLLSQGAFVIDHHQQLASYRPAALPVC
ncbi:hypothetical protein V3G39_13870 [Dermatophilaceae bacterium Sec6.4]